MFDECMSSTDTAFGEGPHLLTATDAVHMVLEGPVYRLPSMEDHEQQLTHTVPDRHHSAFGGLRMPARSQSKIRAEP